MRIYHKKVARNNQVATATARTMDTGASDKNRQAKPAKASIAIAPIAAPRASSAAARRPRRVNANHKGMTNTRKKTVGLADPAKLGSFDTSDEDLIVVIIETPKGSRNKYAYNAKEHVFELKKVLPAGMAFPYDFGFVPSTKGGDGDPLDVLVLMDEPAFAGCKLTCRLVGLIEGEQSGKRPKSATTG